MLKCLDRLLYLVNRRNLSSSFSHLIESVIDEIKSVRRDSSSDRQIEQLIISIEKRLTKKVDEQNHRSSPYGLRREVNSAFDRTLDAIRDLLSSFRRRHRSPSRKESPAKRSRRSRWSTPPPIVPEPMESKPSVPTSFPRRIDDDQSSEASRSSCGEEDLMHIALDAYNKRTK